MVGVNDCLPAEYVSLRRSQSFWIRTAGSSRSQVQYLADLHPALQWYKKTPCLFAWCLGDGWRIGWSFNAGGGQNIAKHQAQPRPMAPLLRLFPRHGARKDTTSAQIGSSMCHATSCGCLKHFQWHWLLGRSAGVHADQESRRRHKNMKARPMRQRTQVAPLSPWKEDELYLQPVSTSAFQGVRLSPGGGAAVEFPHQLE